MADFPKPVLGAREGAQATHAALSFDFANVNVADLHHLAQTLFVDAGADRLPPMFALRAKVDPLEFQYPIIHHR